MPVKMRFTAVSFTPIAYCHAMTVIIGLVLLAVLIVLYVTFTERDAPVVRCPSCGIVALEVEYRPGMGSRVHYHCVKCGASYHRDGDGPFAPG
jgi:DNA-directed RNA polymerase subunit RPC12/RpoP